MLPFDQHHFRDVRDRARLGGGWEPRRSVRTLRLAGEMHRRAFRRAHRKPCDHEKRGQVKTCPLATALRRKATDPFSAGGS